MSNNNNNNLFLFPQLSVNISHLQTTISTTNLSIITLKLHQPNVSTNYNQLFNTQNNNILTPPQPPI